MKNRTFVCGNIDLGTYNPPESHWKQFCANETDRIGWEIIFKKVAKVNSLKCMVYMKIFDERSEDIDDILKAFEDLGMGCINTLDFEPGLIVINGEDKYEAIDKLKHRAEVTFERPQEQHSLRDGVIRVLLGDVSDEMKVTNLRAILFIEPYGLNKVKMFDLGIALAERLNGCVLPYHKPVFDNQDTAELATGKIWLKSHPYMFKGGLIKEM